MKEEYMTKLQYSSLVGTKAEMNLTGSAVDGNQSPLLGLDNNKGMEASPNHAAKQEPFSDPHNIEINYSNMSTDKNLLGHEVSMPPDNFPSQQYSYAAEKSRSQLKSYIGHRAEEMYVYRSLPLGQDRRRNRYWQFATSSSRNDPGSGRIFFESHDGCWRLIDSEEVGSQYDPHDLTLYYSSHVMSEKSRIFGILWLYICIYVCVNGKPELLLYFVPALIKTCKMH